MTKREKAILGTAPAVVRRPGGTWFAVSGPGAPLRIAVEGASERQVRESFKRALEAWAVLVNPKGTTCPVEDVRPA
jgi:hypothetical protein